MSYEPTPTQALLLFGLLAFHGESAQADILPAVGKPDREALEKARLIAVRKVGRALFLKLEDAGWDWAATNLSAELPAPQRTLHEMLGRLGEHLVRSGGSLAAFIGAKPEEGDGSSGAAKTKTSSPAVRTTTKPKTSPSLEKMAKTKASSKLGTAAKAKTSSTRKPKAPSHAAVRKQIETAYLSLTGGPKNQTVRLAHLRAALPQLDRATVDAALGRILQGDTKASLMRHDDPNQLDQADHDAAYSPAGEPFHVIWIAS